MPHRKLAVTLILLAGVCLSTVFSQETGRNARGTIVDESDGVLPGVTVVATAADGRVLATTVTDGAGRYAVGPLAPGPVTLTFQLEGFSQATVPATVKPDADTVVNQRLAVAPRSETVVVVGKVPVPPPPPTPPPPIVLPPPRPRPVTAPVAEHDKDSVCGPAKLATPESLGTVWSRRFKANRLYAEGDELVVDGGTDAGIKIGHNYAVRRTYRIEWDPRTEIGEHTSGVVQIISADASSSVAVVIYACDEILPGDRLASFHPEPRRPRAAAGTPDYRNPARILFPDAGSLVGAPRRMLVIDQGMNTGIRVAQRFTLFRRRASDNRRILVGEAVVVAVRFDSATIRVDRADDAIMSGDLAAPQR